MESKSDQPPLIVIVGETASGKTALAIELAKQFGGEIIAADSRTLYKGMDVGTAKPTLAERSEVKHHLIDVTTPDRPLTAADFKRLAQQAIESISARGKIPILVGGTGLYIDALLYDFSFGVKGNGAMRQKWQDLSVEQLQDELRKRSIALPVNEKNPRHLIRQLETGGMLQQYKPLRANTLILGLLIDRDELISRVSLRVEKMFDDGLVDEVDNLTSQYAWDNPAMHTIGYREFEEYDPEHVTIEDLKGQIKKNTLQYAKRQRTWFRRNKSVHWTHQKEEAVDLITTFLNK